MIEIKEGILEKHQLLKINKIKLNDDATLSSYRYHERIRFIHACGKIL